MKLHGVCKAPLHFPKIIRLQLWRGVAAVQEQTIKALK
jgi:hypothetical protein